MPQPHTRDPYAGWRELTLRGMILGALITVVFTASNVYLGLKVGLTFATSIPAAVISMAVLKFFKGSNILENNMVQTQASAAGTLSTIIFVLPGLLMAGYWNGFPFWQTTLLCVSGGILGVIFTVPLRYAMVVKSSLPYPEGVAAAEILKVGSGEHEDAEQGQSGDSGVREILSGGLLAGLMSFLSGGLRVISDSASYWFKAGNAIFQLPMGFSLALLGAGYLVGLTGGIAILVGIFIAWGGAVPYFSNIIPQPSDMDMTAFAMQLWKEKVRFIGAGTIGIAAVWTLIMLAKPMAEGMRLSFGTFSGSGSASAERTEQDLSPKSMILIVLGMMLLLGFSFYHFIAAAQMSAGIAWTLVVVCTLLTSVIGFLVAAACGYMAGLVGSSASPISGIGIVSIVVISLVLLAVGESSGLFADEGNRQFMLALTLFCGSAVICVASISNDNLQDLKTGYLVKATPRLQQIALIIGCVAGAIVVSRAGTAVRSLRLHRRHAARGDGCIAGAGRAAGNFDDHHHAGHFRAQPAMELHLHRRRHRRGADYRRFHTEEKFRQPAGAARAGGGHGHLPAAVGQYADCRRRVPRRMAEIPHPHPLWRCRKQPETRRPHRHAVCRRPDCRRKPDWRGDGLRYRRFRYQRRFRRAAGPRSEKLGHRRLMARPDRLPARHDGFRTADSEGRPLSGKSKTPAGKSFSGRRFYSGVEAV